MAKNKIQFQKGLSLIEFFSQYGTDQQCRQILFDMRWPQGFICPKCGHKFYCEIDNRKVYQCNLCHRQTSLICGTDFLNPMCFVSLSNIFKRNCASPDAIITNVPFGIIYTRLIGTIK